MADAYGKILVTLRGEGRLRTLEKELPEGELIDLTSNDYLGLRAIRRELEEEFQAGNSGCARSSSASRLLCVSQEPYRRLEEMLENLYGRPALLLNSGYHANVGILQALSIPGTLILSDRLNHASIIDGIRLGGADFKRFPHNDRARLDAILEAEAPKYRQVWIVTESVFSMDGDLAPLKEIAALKKKYGNLSVYLDEAHGVGVRGRKGLGLAEELGLLNDIDIVVGTFGKALFSEGAFAVCSPVMKEYLVNTCRSLIFSTALSPHTVEWTRFMLGKVVGMEQRRERLRAIAARIGSESHIFPLVVGDAHKAVAMAADFQKRGVLVMPIRRPTVPPGTERLRFSLNASLSDEDIELITKLIRECDES